MDIREEEALQMQTKFVTATVTLTSADVLTYGFVSANHASSAIAVTLPAAHAGLVNRPIRIGCTGAAAVTVVAGADSAGTAGFGSAGSSYDTLALELGGEVRCTVRQTTPGLFAWTYCGNTTVAT